MPEGASGPRASGEENVSRHRYIVATVEIKLLDPSTPPATSGPPEQVAASLAQEIKRLTPKHANKNHKVAAAEVISAVEMPE
jgi:hypothetical protein